MAFTVKLTVKTFLLLNERTACTCIAIVDASVHYVNRILYCVEIVASLCAYANIIIKKRVLKAERSIFSCSLELLVHPQILHPLLAVTRNLTSR